MIYLDSNIFIIATLYSDEKGERARGKDAALEAAEAMLGMPYLNFLPVDAAVLWKALEIIRKYNLHPRDAIHLACAALHGISELGVYYRDFVFFYKLVVDSLRRL